MCIFTSLHTWNNATLSHLVLTIALKYSLSSSFCLRFILSLTMCVPVYVCICEYAMKRCQSSWCWNYRKLWVASDESWKLNSGALKCQHTLFTVEPSPSPFKVSETKQSSEWSFSLFNIPTGKIA